MSIANRIITKGLGTSRGIPGRAGPVTLGYGGPPGEIIRALESLKTPRHGKSFQHLEEELYVWAKLIEVNGKQPKQHIEGGIKIKTKEITEHVSAYSLSTRLVENVKILVNRIKRNR